MSSDTLRCSICLAFAPALQSWSLAAHTHQNLNNNLAHNVGMATQEDYDRIQARIDALGEDITRVRRRITAEMERVRSRSL